MRYKMKEQGSWAGKEYHVLANFKLNNPKTTIQEPIPVVMAYHYQDALQTLATGRDAWPYLQALIDASRYAEGVLAGQSLVVPAEIWRSTNAAWCALIFVSQGDTEKAINALKKVGEMLAGLVEPVFEEQADSMENKATPEDDINCWSYNVPNPGICDWIKEAEGDPSSNICKGCIHYNYTVEKMRK